MGMQIHFNIDEVEDSLDASKWYFRYDSESDTMFIVFKTAEHGELAASCGKNRDNGWFDIGSMSVYSMTLLKFLIQNRICFNAS